MKMFDKIINWKLLSGSHDFPGPDGGTCINEAAIVAAGFEYKAVTCVNDCPPCFSRVIAAYAIGLNDRMPDDLRQELLMQFVTRLSGTADTPEIEKLRCHYLAIQTVKRILPVVCRKRLKREDLALSCEAAETLDECRAAAQRVRAADVADAAAYAAYAADAAAYAAYAAADAAADAAYAADAAADAAYAAAYAAAPAARKRVFTVTTEILDGAIKLGRQAAPEDTAVIVGRLEAAKKKVSA